MLSTHDAGWWWPILVLLAPVALAARRKPKRGREPPQKRTPSRSDGRFLVVAVVLFVATVVLVTALRMGSSREARPSTSLGAPLSGTSSEELAGAMMEQWKSMASTVCPRFA